MTRRWACLLGNPVAHSLSPAMHNAAFAALGIPASFEARQVLPAELPQAVEALRDPQCLGANVTAPYKQDVVPLLDVLAGEARLLGAVNTIVPTEGGLTGDNTDALGLAAALAEAGLAPLEGLAVVLGAGGAARAAVLALARCGATRVLVLNRTLQRAEALLRDLAPALNGVQFEAAPLERAALPPKHPPAVVVNATSLGHHGGAPALHPSWTPTGSAAVELAYNPPRTAFMQRAHAGGARTTNGLGMLVHQAAFAFERWTGCAAPIEVMRAAVEGVLLAPGVSR